MYLIIYRTGETLEIQFFHFSRRFPLVKERNQLKSYAFRTTYFCYWYYLSTYFFSEYSKLEKYLMCDFQVSIPVCLN